MLRMACLICVLAACGLKDDPLPVESTRALPAFDFGTQPALAPQAPLTAALPDQHGELKFGDTP